VANVDEKNRSSSETLVVTHSSERVRRLDGSDSDSKELVISTPDATGLGVDIARVLLSFGLSVVRFGQPSTANLGPLYPDVRPPYHLSTLAHPRNRSSVT
jgi:hypothetical protein